MKQVVFFAFKTVFAKQQSFAADLTAQIRNIVTSGRGGGLVINNLLDPSSDYVLEKTYSSRATRVVDKPFEGNAFLMHFSVYGHENDGYTILELVDRKSRTFAPRVRSWNNYFAAGIDRRLAFWQTRRGIVLRERGYVGACLNYQRRCGRLTVY